MKKYALLLLILTGLNFCTAGKIETEFQFANKLAEEKLWKEAYYRYQKCLTANQNHAALHNNLAVTLEGMGKWQEAEQEYQKALLIDPKNTLIKENYDQLQNFLKGDHENDQQKDFKKEDHEKENFN